jgi:hypothetical protein
MRVWDPGHGTAEPERKEEMQHRISTGDTASARFACVGTPSSLLRTVVTAVALLAVVGGANEQAVADTITFTSNTTIGCNDVTYDGYDIIVDGCTVTIDGVHEFANMDIINNGVVTHSVGVAGFDLSVTGDLTIASGGSITSDGKGYGNSGPGGGDAVNTGYGWVYGGGGGYGGMGGDGRNGTTGGAAYGSITEPTELGSGGGSTGGTGGGSIRLTVGGTLTVDGALTCNGADGTVGGSGTVMGGGGSGGSIYITASILTGTGVISANGGLGTVYGGGGGGGRIAVYYDTLGFSGSESACGGDGYRDGGAGTLYTKAAMDPAGNLRLDNCGYAHSLTPLLDSYTFDTIDVGSSSRMDVGTSAILSANSIDVHDGAQVHVRDNGGIVFPVMTLSSGGTFILDKAQTLGELQVNSGGIVTHTGGVAGFDLSVTGDLTIASGGSITSDGKGYGNSGPGGGDAVNTGYGWVYGGGGGYGGMGGDGRNGTTGGAAYGSITEPTELGSGGGSTGGTGGGSIRLTVGGTLTVDGALTCNGADGTVGGSGTVMGGGGSGGSIYITASILTGTGVISANGGLGTVYGGGGGGGRIAVYYDTLGFSRESITVDGGMGYQAGEVGTAYYGYGGIHSAVYGTVYDAVTGQAIVGAEVIVPYEVPLQTDVRGEFSFSGLTPMSFTLRVARAGYYEHVQPVTLHRGSSHVANVDLAPVSSTVMSPIVIDVTGSFCGPSERARYLDTVSLHEAFTATIDWQDHTPGTVRWITPNQEYEDPFSGVSVTRSFDMGSVFGEGGMLLLRH